MSQFEADSNNELTPSTDRKRLKKDRDPTLEEVAACERAAEYVAGDLNDEETCRFEELFENSAELQAEVAFWKQMNKGLQREGRPEDAHSPGAGFNEVLRRRLEREQKLTQPKRIRRWPWFCAAPTAFLAVFVMVGIGAHRTADNHTAPHPDGANLIGHVDQGGNPYALGMTSQVASLSRHEGRVLVGLRVVNVKTGCVAERLGIRPGDIVISVDDQSIRCPWQLAANMATCGPNEVRKLTVYHPQDARMETIEVSYAHLSP